jgi:hypothetical protein
MAIEPIAPVDQTATRKGPFLSTLSLLCFCTLFLVLFCRNREYSCHVVAAPSALLPRCGSQMSQINVFTELSGIVNACHAHRDGLFIDPGTEMTLTFWRSVWSIRVALEHFAHHDIDHCVFSSHHFWETHFGKSHSGDPVGTAASTVGTGSDEVDKIAGATGSKHGTENIHMPELRSNVPDFRDGP